MINCYCHLKTVDFGFCVLGRFLKVGFEPDCVVITTLIRGLCSVDRVGEAVMLFTVSDRVVKGIQTSSIACGTIIHGLCKVGNNHAALRLLRKMEERNLLVDVVVCSTIIDSLCKDRLVNEAYHIFLGIMWKGVLPNVTTFNSMINGLCGSSR